MKKLLFTVLSIIIIILSVLLVKHSNNDLYHAIEVNREIQEAVLTPEETSPVEETTTDPFMNPNRVDFSTLKSINQDIYGWLTIPNTIVDYPVLSEETDEFYLWRDIYKNPNKVGSLFTPKLDSHENLSNLLIFGHQMVGTREAVVFSHIGEYYADLSTGLDYEYAYLYQPGKVTRYQLVGLFETDETDPVYEVPYLLDTEDYDDLLKEISKKLLYINSEAEEFFTKEHPILVLSTCRGRIGGEERTVAVFVGAS